MSEVKVTFEQYEQQFIIKLLNKINFEKNDFSAFEGLELKKEEQFLPEGSIVMLYTVIYSDGERRFRFPKNEVIFCRVSSLAKGGLEELQYFSGYASHWIEEFKTNVYLYLDQAMDEK